MQRFHRLIKVATKIKAHASIVRGVIIQEGEVLIDEEECTAAIANYLKGPN